MSKVLVRYRSIALAVSLVALTACGRDGTGPGRLTPQDVGGVYHICHLVFTPNNAALYPAVDIRAAVMDTSPAAESPARLYLDQALNQFALQYMRGTFLERHEGTYALGQQNVDLAFANPAPVLTRLLLPGVVTSNFQPNPRRLEFTRAQHDVTGQDYAILRGISPEGAPQQIRGAVSGHFQVGGCS